MKIMNKQAMMILAVVVIGAVGFVGFKFAEPKKSEFQVEYKVDCKSCDVYFRNDKGESQEVVGINDNWSYKYTGTVGQFAYVAAASDRGNEVKVTILKDGVPVESGISNQPKVSARAGLILY
ncbi:MAG: hypothetical protein KatS3mg031_2165 [Chitinophagales bacterium]|nr:MAG: hypothetical protein KatS3mg031_2165 [Chitinophagales bacterium]